MNQLLFISKHSKTLVSRFIFKTNVDQKYNKNTVTKFNKEAFQYYLC